MMKTTFLLLTTLLFLSACQENEPINSTGEETTKLDQQSQTVSTKNVSIDTITKETTIAPEIEIKDNIYTEYYPGTRRIKFRGQQDEQGRRDGTWMYFGEDGTELSMTTYKNGKKHGPTMVKYPNGNIHYTGEYTDDKASGTWTTYSEIGEKLTVKNFDELK